MAAFARLAPDARLLPPAHARVVALAERLLPPAVNVPGDADADAE